MKTQAAMKLCYHYSKLLINENSMRTRNINEVNHPVVRSLAQFMDPLEKNHFQ